MNKKNDNLKAAFSELREAGVYAKMNSGYGLEETYNNLLEKVEQDELFFGFVGFSNVEGKARNKQSLIPLTWGVPERMTPEKIKIRRIIVDVLEKHGVVADANVKLNLYLDGVGDNIIIISETKEAFEKFQDQMEAAKKSFIPQENPCKDIEYDTPPVYELEPLQESTQKEKYTKTLKTMKRGSDFIREPKLVGRPVRNEPINYRDIEYLQKLNDGVMDVNVFVRLV